eukprot:scaffold7236_cov69-Phaeocystis_antarctica.AAC.2
MHRVNRAHRAAVHRLALALLLPALVEHPPASPVAVLLRLVRRSLRVYGPAIDTRRRRCHLLTRHRAGNELVEDLIVAQRRRHVRR